MSRLNGTIKARVTERHFGFITGDDGRDFFFHGSDIAETAGPLEAGDYVSFEPVDPEPPKGPRARRIGWQSRFADPPYDDVQPEIVGHVHVPHNPEEV